MTADPPRGRGRPRREGGPDPVRSVRVGEVWQLAAEKADRDGETMPALVTRLLTAYVQGP